MKLKLLEMTSCFLFCFFLFFWIGLPVCGGVRSNRGPDLLYINRVSNLSHKYSQNFANTGHALFYLIKWVVNRKKKLFGS